MRWVAGALETLVRGLKSLTGGSEALTRGLQSPTGGLELRHGDLQRLSTLLHSARRLLHGTIGGAAGFIWNVICSIRDPELTKGDRPQSGGYSKKEKNYG